MDYKKIYDKLCSSRKKRGLDKEAGYEIHHILPRSMGGSDEDTNLVKLTYREHFLAHKLLYKFTTGEDKVSMAYALNLMSSQKSIKTSKAYEETNSYLKYSNKFVLRKDKGYVYMKHLKLVEAGLKIKHEGFNTGNINGSKRLSALYFICKELNECGIKGIVSAHRSSWKNCIRKLEKLGFFDTFTKEGRKFYKFKKSSFQNKDFPLKDTKNLSLYKLLPESPLYGTKRLLIKYNKENPLKAVIIEKSHVKNRYYILPAVSGWIPSDKALNTRQDVKNFLNKT